MSNRDAGMWFFGFFAGLAFMFIIIKVLVILKAIV